MLENDPENEDPMGNIAYPDDDRLSFWGVPYQFDHVFGPGTEQSKVNMRATAQKILCDVLAYTSFCAICG